MVVTKIVIDRVTVPEFGLLEITPECVGRFVPKKVARVFLLWCWAGLRLKSRRAGNGGGGTQKQADKKYSDVFHSTVKASGWRHIE
jgi:hypothetical protein